MVTKLCSEYNNLAVGSVLAKIHMVTKHSGRGFANFLSSVLAKIHMVTKPQKHAITFLN